MKKYWNHVSALSGARRIKFWVKGYGQKCLENTGVHTKKLNQKLILGDNSVLLTCGKRM